MTRPPCPKILYIGGWGRSGSTLMGQLLGAQPGYVSVGELRFIWERGVINNELCSCAQPFLQCTFWSEVGSILGGWHRQTAIEMLEYEKRYQRLHQLLQLGTRTETAPADLIKYRRKITDLYRAIHEVSAGNVIVDSSKDAPWLALIAGCNTLDVRSIHLVRDSRAAAHSWQRQKRRPEIVDRVENMPTLSATRAAREYMIAHSAHEYLAKRVPTSRLRYEEFATSNGERLSTAVKRLGYEFDGAPIDMSPPDHSISGNPGRFTRGVPSLTLDDQWISALPRRDFNVTTWLTLPLLKKYKYPTSRRASSEMTW